MIDKNLLAYMEEALQHAREINAASVHIFFPTFEKIINALKEDHKPNPENEVLVTELNHDGYVAASTRYEAAGVIMAQDKIITTLLQFKQDAIKAMQESGKYSKDSGRAIAFNFLERYGIPLTENNITCPRCGRTSWNANDIREGYCGNCHDWTAKL